MSRKRFPHVLIYAGAIPFMTCAILLFLEIQTLPLLGSVETIMAIYGVVIASFLSGIHWGQHLNIDSKKNALFLAISSNINALILWAGYLSLSLQFFFILLIISLFTSLVIDCRLYKNENISKDYLKTRAIVTVIACLSIGTTFLSISGFASNNI